MTCLSMPISADKWYRAKLQTGHYVILQGTQNEGIYHFFFLEVVVALDHRFLEN